MTQRFSAPSWLLWTISSSFIVLVTRNPLYLVLVLVSVIAVYLSLEHRSAIALAWSTVLRIGAVIALISVVFNLLTVHSGDLQFGSLPESLPIVGGALTWNAVVYGAISGMALMCLLLIAATLSTAVDRGAMVRMVPQSFGTIGIAAIAALSIFPQTIQAIGQVRESHRTRGLQIRSIRDLQRLVVPVLDIGLERAFHLAESMESRAFGHRASGPGMPVWFSLGILVLMTTGIVTVAIGYLLAGGLILGCGLITFALLARSRGAHPISHYRESNLARPDIPVVASALSMIGVTAIALIASDDSLVFSTYPELDMPSFSVLIGIACILPVLPAILPGPLLKAEPNGA
ncbi:MAG: energy-coupling factor transporter transmembrane component T [Thermomicrobiaceae bacterium]